MNSGYQVVNWDMVTEASIKLAESIIASGFRPSVVIAVMRGGYVVARLLSDLLNVGRLLTIGVKSYLGIGVRSSNPIIVANELGIGSLDDVLIVDDVVDSGNTMRLVTNYVGKYNPRSIRTAVLFYKPWSMIKPDYYAYTSTKWIVFPWSLGEVLRQLSINRDLGVVIKELNLGDYFSFNVLNGVVRIIKASDSLKGKGGDPII